MCNIKPYRNLTLAEAQFGRHRTSHELNLKKIIPPVDLDAELNSPNFLPNLIQLRQIKRSGLKIHYNNLRIRFGS